MICILALDGGLATSGAIVVQTDGRSHGVVGAYAFESEQRADDFDIRMCDDRVRRAREYHAWLRTIGPSMHIDIVAAEAMSFPRGAHAIVAVSLAWGVLASFLEERRLPIVTAMPSYWRTALLDERPTRGGSKAAQQARSKDREHRAHIAAAHAIGPTFVRAANRIPNRLQVHVLDAGGVFAWSLRTPLVREMIMRSQ